MKNVRPTCTGCGQCCRNFAYPPFLGIGEEPGDADGVSPDSELAALRAAAPDLYRSIMPRVLDAALAPSGDGCEWLDKTTLQCIHYEHRPQVCRDFVLASESCRHQRKDVGLTVEGWPIYDDDGRLLTGIKKEPRQRRRR